MARKVALLLFLSILGYAQGINGGSFTAGNNLFPITLFTTGVVFSGTYTSGITTTGTVGQTCIVTITNGGGTGATATLALTGTNAVAASTALVITAAGTGFTSAPTAATATTGTAAACSGTLVIATVISQTVTTPGWYYTNFAGPLRYNLPTITAGTIGSVFCFRNYTTFTGIMTIAAPASGTFIDSGGTNTASGGNVTSGGAAADSACFISTLATEYLIYNSVGTWTRH